jgi:NAD(P)-dependent dehydrogenase (short-subunit alcohol dehydrogenase family)
MGSIKLEGKLVWITGASSGLGRELALAACRKGARVVISSSQYNKLERTMQECRRITDTCYFLLLDQSRPGDIASAVKRVTEKHGQVQVLINNAGVSQRAGIMETTEETLRQIMEIDFFSAALLTRELLPGMIKAGGGQIAVTSSVTGHYGFQLRSGYAAAKHALHGWFETLALEHAKDNIGVTIVCPGKIKTPISLSALRGDGKPWGIMDKSQENGLSAQKCAQVYIKAIEKRRCHLLIGGREVLAARLKALFPKLVRRALLAADPH